jgi:hypothetical protein
MIYTRLKGGLGNMLFQIAATYSIALEKNTTPSFYNLDGQLTYLNNEKGFNPKLNHSFEYKNLNGFNNLTTSTPPNGTPVYRYPFHYQNIQTQGDNFIVDGFFQSEKYFIKHEKEIKELFKPTENILNLISEKYSDYLKNKTTAVHVRRGDYVKHRNIHPPQDLQYYRNSISLTEYDKILVFSDDLSWCKNNFIGDEFIFIEGEKDYVELYLMSMCDNVITSNSSFSWWGAWLNNNPNKKVIGPKKWFGESVKNSPNHITKDILPDSWIKM